ncbi:hypothetical protein COPG_00070 [Colwellia phage 9A]|uniref:Uncharacterized protein n=1 Tax=Colwellia phage 9A TaxID=765765 RepID=I3UMF1_9CAUD|nr:hypothetical protein COPG_00070 [Colwellia phage 9A]AFK66666.1 hypothetical protein COPG_00070 [Colwellia phage 9A]
MSGFYYEVRLVDLELTPTQVTKIRDYIRSQVRDMAAIDSGDFLRSLKTSWNKGTKILRIYSELYYAGYIEGGNINYVYHKDKIQNVLIRMGLKVSPRRYF